MVMHLKKIAAGLAALTALALGGSALAQAGGTTATPTPKPAATSTASETPGTQSGAADRDNVRSGDQSAPETPDAEKGESAQEPPESTSETEGSEVRGDHGPGGHADEPANPNADHQHEGTE